MRRNPEQRQKDFEKYREWQQRSRDKALKKRQAGPTTFASHKPKKPPVMKPWAKQKVIRQQSNKRQQQESYYHALIPKFLADHPICPVTGQPTNQIHHSAKREGGWLLLRRYWIAVSMEGHRWIEDNAKEAAELGLMVRIFVPYATHLRALREGAIDPIDPVFYHQWDGNILVDKYKTGGIIES